MLTFKHLQYGAAAIALGCALGMTASAGAQIVETDTMDVDVVIESTFNLTVTQDINLATVSLFTTSGGADPTVGVDTAGARIAPAGGDSGNFFFVVNDTGLTEGNVTIDGAQASEIIHITIPTASVVHPALGTEVLTIVDADYLETSPGSTTDSANISSADLTVDITTDTSGNAAFSLGITIAADADASAQYTDGAYDGDIVINANY